jgi:hypothetical protein
MSNALVQFYACIVGISVGSAAHGFDWGLAAYAACLYAAVLSRQ